MNKWAVIAWDEYEAQAYVYDNYEDAKERFGIITGYHTKNTYLTVVTEEQEYFDITEKD